MLTLQLLLVSLAFFSAVTDGATTISVEGEEFPDGAEDDPSFQDAATVAPHSRTTISVEGEEFPDGAEDGPPVTDQITVEESSFHDDLENTEGYFQGDMEMPKFRNTINYRSLLWPNGVVRYDIDSGYNAQAKAKIREAMDTMEANLRSSSGSCISFAPKQPGDTDYVYFVALNGCHSPVGKRRGKGQISLASGCLHVGVIIHELLHTLGVFHQQSRTDRDDYLEVNTDNVEDDKVHNFDKLKTESTLVTLDNYDFSSIMQYSAFSFAKDKSKPTIYPKEKYVKVAKFLGQRQYMTASDVRLVQKLYQCTIDVSHISQPSIRNNLVECDFEENDDAKCKLEQATDDDFNWSFTYGSTPSQGTGPNGDHTNGGGRYSFIEASGKKKGQKAVWRSTVFVPQGQVCIALSYNNYGKHKSKLTLYVEGPNIPLFKLQEFTGSSYKGWDNIRFNVGLPAKVKVIIEATVGEGYQGDVAIDDVFIYSAKCTDF